MAYNYNKLLGKIKEKYDTQKLFATALGVSYTTLNRKLNNHVKWTDEEIDLSCKLLNINIDDVNKYFFNKEIRITEPIRKR